MVQDPNWGTEHIPDNVETGHNVANTTLDEIIQGVSDPFDVDLSSGNVTLTDDEYVLNFTFQCTGHSVARDLTLNASLKKYCIIDNQGTAAGIVSFINGSTTRTIEVGEIATFYCDGTTNNLIKIGSNFALDTSLSGVITETGTSHSPDVTQANKYIKYTNASAITVTIEPNSSEPFVIGTVLTFEQNNVGQVTIAEGGGVTVNFPSSVSLLLLEQYAVASVVKVDTDVWTLMGALST